MVGYDENLFRNIQKSDKKPGLFFGFYSFTHNWENLQNSGGFFFTRRDCTWSHPLYSLQLHQHSYKWLHTYSIHIGYCTCIQWIRVYVWFHTFVSIVAYAFNGYVYTYDCTHLYWLFCKCIQCICVYVWLYKFVSIVLHMHPMYMCIHLSAQVRINCCQMHPMHMCIRMIAHVRINCFAYASNVYVYTFECTGSYRLLPNASDAYVYTYDCTRSYQLFCICIQCICVYIWVHRSVSIVANASNEYVYTYDYTHIHIDCFANASNAYVYTYDCTCLDRLLHTHHPMHRCIRMIAHVRIDCFAYASNAYEYTYMIAHVRIYCYLFTSFSIVEKKKRE
jgi:hypothetical protein